MATTAQRALLAAAAGIVALTALAACTPDAPKATESTTSAPVETPSPTAAAEPVFVEPTSCTTLLGAALETELLATGDVLFSAPDGSGLYPGTVSNQAGTPFSCWYGRDLVDLSSYEIAAQPLTQSSHEGTLAGLQSEGFTETATGDVVLFTSTGDEGTEPAVLHELHPDGWITIYSAFGGEDRLTTMKAWLDEIRAQVYPSP
ncbi:hypothetical protein BH09ACT3_BH09ACT3_08140 [soil metagenome]